jgi:large subunit ribosomal protein L17
MRHRNRRGKLGRKTAHRLMMLRNLATSLFDKERVMTTLPKAKQLRPFAEKLITLARKQDLQSRRLTLEQIQNKEVVKKLFDVIAQRFKTDNGGYTRIVPFRTRWGDGAELAFIELKNPVLPEKKQDKEGKKKKAAPAEKSDEAAEAKGAKEEKKERKPKKTTAPKKAKEEKKEAKE